MPDETETELNKFWNKSPQGALATATEEILELDEHAKTEETRIELDKKEEKLTEDWHTAQEERRKKARHGLVVELTARGVPKSEAIKISEEYHNVKIPEGNFFFDALISILDMVLGLVGTVGPYIGAQGASNMRTLAKHTKHVLPPLDAILRASYLDKTKNSYPLFAQESGIGPKEWETIRKGFEKPLTLEQLQRLRFSAGWDDAELTKHLTRLGMNIVGEGLGKQPLPSLLWTMESRPPVTDLLEMSRRKIIEPDTLKEAMAFWGFSPKTRAYYDLMKVPAFGLPIIQEFFRRGHIDETVRQGMIEMLGYDTEWSEQLADMQQIPISLMEAREGFWRGEIEEPEFLDRLKRLGYNINDAQLVNKISWLLPTPQDLIRFSVREVYTPKIREHFRQDEDYPPELSIQGRKIGLREETLKEYWAAHWILPAPGQGWEMYHRGIITKDEMYKLMHALDIMPFWQDKMVQMIFKQIPRRTLPRLARYRLVDEKDLTKRFGKLGYTAKDAGILAKEAIIRAEEGRQTLTKAEIVDAYKLGFVNAAGRDKLFEKLQIRGVELLYLQKKSDLKKLLYHKGTGAAGAAKAAAEAKELTKSEILRGIKTLTVKPEHADTLLEKLGFTDTAREYLINFAIYQRMQENKSAFARSLEKQYKANTLTIPETEGQLVNRGYTMQAARSLTDLWKLELETDRILAAQKTKPPSKADVENWLVKGIIDTDEWSIYMGMFGYSAKLTEHYLQEIIVDLGETK